VLTSADSERVADGISEIVLQVPAHVRACSGRHGRAGVAEGGTRGESAPWYAAVRMLVADMVWL
jgi:hypothetical protein